MKLAWTEVDSSNVKSIAYHDQTETLCVLFNNGGLYSYSQVDQEVYVSLVHAESVGRYLNNAIKGVFPYQRWSSELELLESISAV
jgi:hypothetical protein